MNRHETAKFHVAVLGAGLAGLTAALRLGQAGFPVTVFEARDRLGGRTHTVRADGTAYEAGGEWIDADHHRMLGLMTEFGIVPSAARDGIRRYEYAGESCRSDAVWPEAQADADRFYALAGRLFRAPTWPAELAEAVPGGDTASLQRLVSHACQTARGEWLLSAQLRSDEGDELDRIGLMGWLAGYGLYAMREGDEASAYRFPNGISEMLDQMAHASGAKFHLATPIQSVRATPTGVLIETAAGPHAFDAAICTVPPKPAQRIAFEGFDIADQRAAWAACGMSRAIKFTLEFSDAFAFTGPDGGNALTDRTVGQLWTGAIANPHPTLTAYVVGDPAEALARLPEADAIGRVLADIDAMYPGAAERFRRGWRTDWIQDPWCEGAFSHLAPGYVLAHYPNVGRPAGRLFFAGEHTSVWTGFMEGAVESAERAIDELTLALGLHPGIEP
ncbi:MAG: NAD(P)/FAD-dependent oxidoreductase [Fimbriimonadaceae bacterium]|nr:NAD(P)/FAD-dependent oxidoreductase [Fimbriimonadaceae bacterium]